MDKRKTIIITLSLLLVLVGGAGGYLLWRVNQKDTVAPTDSDAGLDCLQREITVTLYPYKSEEGDLVYDNKLGTIKTYDGVDTNYLELTLKDSCAIADTITATPKEGYKFVRWDDAVRQRRSTNPSITIRYKDYTDGSVNKLRAIYEKADSDTNTHTVTYEAFCGDNSDITLLTCAEPTGRVSADKACFNQKVAKDGIGKPVWISNPKGEECVFKYWEIDGKEVGREVPHRVKGIEKDTKVVARFEKIYKGANFSLKYSSKGEGDLKVDGSLVKAYPVTIQFTDGQPYPKIPVVEAVPKNGWVFDAWESNIRSFTSISDRTKNPRHDKDRKVDLDIIAVYKKKGDDVPPRDTNPDIPDTPVKPPSSSKDTGTDIREEKMPQTSAFSDRSLYVISIGALVLCLGMVWQYIPKDIFKRFRK